MFIFDLSILKMQLEIPTQYHNTTNDNSPSSNGDQQTNVSFPAHIYAMLENPMNNEIIGWINNGKEFKIFDIDRFENETINQYFIRKCFYIFLNYIQL